MNNDDSTIEDRDSFTLNIWLKDGIVYSEIETDMIDSESHVGKLQATEKEFVNTFLNYKRFILKHRTEKICPVLFLCRFVNVFLRFRNAYLRTENIAEPKLIISTAPYDSFLTSSKL